MTSSQLIPFPSYKLQITRFSYTGFRLHTYVSNADHAEHQLHTNAMSIQRKMVKVDRMVQYHCLYVHVMIRVSRKHFSQFKCTLFARCIVKYIGKTKYLTKNPHVCWSIWISVGIHCSIAAQK